MTYDQYKLQTPPENDTKCDNCGEPFAEWDLHLLIIKSKPIDVCYECLLKLTEDENS